MDNLIHTNNPKHPRDFLAVPGLFLQSGVLLICLSNSSVTELGVWFVYVFVCVRTHASARVHACTHVFTLVSFFVDW